MEHPEPFTSILIRELTILAREFGHVSRACWLISRALREHLQPDVECATDGSQLGVVSGKRAPHQAELPLLPYPESGPSSREAYE